MGETTKISWCDHTWSPWRGCTHAILPDGSEHPGCLRCYAEAMAHRFPKRMGTWGQDEPRVLAAEQSWKQIEKWNVRARNTSVPESVFPSVCDPFEEHNGPILSIRGEPIQVERFANPESDIDTTRPATLDDLRCKLFSLIDATPNLDWLLLTKRPQNVRRMWATMHAMRTPFPGMLGPFGQPMPCVTENAMRRNVRLGVSASDQKTWDWATEELAKLGDLCPVRFVSLEPMLGPVECGCTCFVCDNTEPGGGVCRNCGKRAEWRGIQQTIIGCESNGPRVGRLGEFKSESAWIDAATAVVDQCRAADVCAFVKQIPINGRVSHDPAEWPEALRVQEFPKASDAA